MYARIVRAHYDPTQEAEVTRLAQEHLLPAYRRLPGFQGHMGGVDRAAQQTVSITTWDTEEQATRPREELGEVVALLQGSGVVFDMAPEVYEVTLPE